MLELIDRTGLRRSRRHMLGWLGGAAMLGVAPSMALGQGRGAEPNEAQVLRDPEIPVAGNPDGDIAIVEWFDYNCPYCRKLEPELRQVVQDDGKVRLVLKDWPILGPVSVVAARQAGSRRQGQDHRRHPRAQQRAGGGTGLSWHAVLHRRQVPRAGRAHNGG